MEIQTYKLNGRSIQFDVESYCSSSMGVLRKDMPQIDMNVFLKNLSTISQYLPIDHLKIAVSLLQPTQCEIDFSKVLISLAKHRELDDLGKTFICDMNGHIIDGHHRHVELLIDNPDQLVNVYKFTTLTNDDLFQLCFGIPGLTSHQLDISGDKVVAVSQEVSEALVKINEDYGMQGPESIPGQGAVDLGAPTTADSEGVKGSGDIPSGEKGRFYTSAELKDISAKYRKKTADIAARLGVDESIVESMGDISPEEWKEMHQYKSQLENDSCEDETMYENANLKLTKHFDNADGLELLTCMNKPLQRKCIQINEPFSCNTLEGITQGKSGDYLVQGIDNEIYPCDKDIFEETYVIQHTT